MGLFEEALLKREEILGLRQEVGESIFAFYKRVKFTSQEYNNYLSYIFTKLGVDFDTRQNNDELIIIVFVIGIRMRLRKYMFQPYEYKTLISALIHAQKIEMRSGRLRPVLDTIKEV